MALPTFRSLGARRQARSQQNGENAAEQTSDRNSERTLTPGTGVNLKLATKTRRYAIWVSCVLYFLSVIFLILTIIGNINKKSVIRSTWFLKLDLTNIIPASAGNSLILVNSLARSLGLHDFYQVGLWNFCEGYNGEGITNCSTPKSLYWFNPVEILLSELLAGATIALPAEINNILSLIRIASHLMFGFFLTGVCMNFVNIFLAPIVIYSRWVSLAFSIWTFIAALLTAAATIIATVLFTIFRNVLTSQAGLNIGASLGTQMFAFMWIGTGCSLIGWLIHLCLSCCGTSRRDVRTGRKKGSNAAYGDAAADEKKAPAKRRMHVALPKFARRKTAGETV